MIISVDVEIHLTKHPFMIKTLIKVGKEENIST